MSVRTCYPRFAPTTFHHWGPASLVARHPQNDIYAPFISLLDDLANVGEATTQASNRHHHRRGRVFAPRFDLKEDKDSYTLEGELPGVDQKDISIEFTDEHTLVVSGRSESSREEGNRPSETEASAEKTPAAVEDVQQPSHKATVEDANEDAPGPSSDAAANTDAASTTPAEVAKQSEDGKKAPQHTYWVSERSSGSFTRSFSFPQRIDQDAVKATFKNGLLSVAVPKAAAPESRRIAIE